MFADYKAQVILAYNKKKAAGGLSLNLSPSTPAKLRAECMIVLTERLLKQDEGTLRMFFGPRNDASAYMQIIRKFDADKFKPLDNFLKGTTNDTDDKNIELLAWLIGFEPRPYKFGQVNVTNETVADKVAESEDNKPGNEINCTSAHVIQDVKDIRQNATANIPNLQKNNASAKPVAEIIIKKRIILFVIIAFISVGIYLMLHYNIKNTPALHTTIIGKQKCMYWTGDYYQPISCDQKLVDTPVFALDAFRLSHFKRVTRPDTITIKSLNKFWYFRAGDTLQVYNSPGAHPVFMDRRLLPLNAHMLNKYILHK